MQGSIILNCILLLVKTDMTWEDDNLRDYCFYIKNKILLSDGDLARELCCDKYFEGEIGASEFEACIEQVIPRINDYGIYVPNNFDKEDDA